MKNFILLSCALSLGAYAYFGLYKSEIKMEKIKEEAKSTRYFNVDEVDSIQLSRNQKTISSFIKKNDVWLVNEPFEDLASQEKLSKWVESLSEIKHSHIIDKDKSYKPSLYGFDKPYGKITIRSKKNNITKSFIIGSISSYDNQIYVLDSDKDDRIFILNPKYKSYFQQELSSLKSNHLWRNKSKIFNMDDKDIVEVKFSLGERSWCLVKKVNKWLPKDDSSLDSFSVDVEDGEGQKNEHIIDVSLVDKYISDILNLKTTNLSNSNQSEEKNKPVKISQFFDMSISLKNKRGELFSLDVQDSNDSLFLFVDYGKDGNNPGKYKHSKKRKALNAYRVKTNLLNEPLYINSLDIFNIVKPLHEFYNRQWPYVFDKRSVSAIELSTKLNPSLHIIKNKNKKWEVVSSKANENLTLKNKVNQESVLLLVSKLSSLKADNFNFTSQKRINTNDKLSNVKYINLLDKNKNVLFSIKWGEKYKIKSLLVKKDIYVYDVITSNDPIGLTSIVSTKLDNIDKNVLNKK